MSNEDRSPSRGGPGGPDVLPSHLAPGHQPPPSRRDFLAFCSAIAVTLGLGRGGARRVEAALTSGLRPPIVWLHFAECTGCTEAALRVVNPYFDELILTKVSLDYHETLMVAAGASAEALRAKTVTQSAGQFFCVVEGAIPTAAGGAYGTVGGKTMLAIAEEICPQAKAVIALGACASYGGLPAAAPNPTSALGVSDALPNLTVPVINLPGCPPNPIAFASVIVNYLLTGTLPTLDVDGRPTFHYGHSVHSVCPYASGQADHPCLKPLGCKGPRTGNNCPSSKYNEGTSFCMQAGHPCIGCSEPGFWDSMTPFWTTYGVTVDAAAVGKTYGPTPGATLGGSGGTGGSADAGARGTGGGGAGATGSGGTMVSDGGGTAPAPNGGCGCETGGNGSGMGIGIAVAGVVAAAAATRREKRSTTEREP